MEQFQLISKLLDAINTVLEQQSDLSLAHKRPRNKHLPVWPDKTDQTNPDQLLKPDNLDLDKDKFHISKCIYPNCKTHLSKFQDVFVLDKFILENNMFHKTI